MPSPSLTSASFFTNAAKRSRCQVWIFDELLEPVQVVGVVRDRMEGVRHADVVVGAVRPFGDHDVGRDTREVGLIGQRDQIEEQIDLLVERVQLADRRLAAL